MWTKYEQLKRKNEALSLIFSREIFYVTVVLCLNILWLKAVNEITASLGEDELAYVNITS